MTARIPDVDGRRARIKLRSCSVCGTAFIYPKGRRTRRCEACIAAKRYPTRGPRTGAIAGPACVTCGVAKHPLLFERDARKTDGLQSECRECRRSRKQEYGRRAETRALASNRQRTLNEESKLTAERHGSVWTGAELDYIMTSPATVAAKARNLGRTAWAVQSAIQRCRHEPKYAALAGAVGSDGPH